MPQGFFDQQNLPQFDAMRRRVQQQSGGMKQENQDALARKFAAMGQLNSGAFAKTSQVANEQADQSQAQQLNDVNSQEQQELGRRQELQQGQEYQANEASKGRDFQKQLFDADMSFKTKVFDNENFWKNIDNTYREKEFSENQKNNKISALLNMRELGFGVGGAGGAEDQLRQLSR